MKVKSFPVQQKVTSFINGAFVDPRTDAHRLPVINPATEEVISELYEADAAEVNLAVESAASAFQSDGKAFRRTLLSRIRESGYPYTPRQRHGHGPCHTELSLLRRLSRSGNRAQCQIR